MRWLPYEILVLQTPQSPEEAAAQLAATVEPQKLLRFKKTRSFFEGTVDSQAFHIQRIITGRNSFLPQIDGTFDPQPEGTRVKITFTISPLAAIFMFIWFAATILFGIATIMGVFTQGTSILALLIPPAFAAFGFLLMSTCFWPEVAKATDRLKDAWKVNVAKPS